MRSKRARKLLPQLTGKERAQLRQYKEIRQRANEAFLRTSALYGLEVPTLSEEVTKGERDNLARSIKYQRQEEQLWQGRLRKWLERAKPITNSVQ